MIDMFMVHVEKTGKDGETTCAKFSLHQVWKIVKAWRYEDYLHCI